MEKSEQFSQFGLHPAGNSLWDRESGIDFVLECKFRGICGRMRRNTIGMGVSSQKEKRGEKIEGVQT